MIPGYSRSWMSDGAKDGFIDIILKSYRSVASLTELEQERIALWLKNAARKSVSALFAALVNGVAFTRDAMYGRKSV